MAKQLKSIKFPGLDEIYEIPEGGAIEIDFTGANEGEPNPINADTLGGVPAEDYIKKDDAAVVIKNYSIVGSTTEPENPTENMIWINTETLPIGKVYFSDKEPVNCNDNSIWVLTGKSSNVSFDSLQVGNEYMNTIHPIIAKQYIDGVWIDKIAKTYLNNKWVDWIVFIINNGINHYTIAVKDVFKERSLLTTDLGYIISYTSSEAASGFGSDGIVYFEEFTSYDLSHISEIVLESTFIAAPESGRQCKLAIWQTLEGADSDNYVSYIDVTDGTIRLPVDTLNGEYCIGLFMSTIQPITLKVSNMYLK